MNVPKLRFKEFNDESYRKDILKNIISYIADNRGKNPDYYLDSGIPVIDNFMIQNQGYPDLSRANRYIDNNIYENFIRKAIEYNDTLITLVGNGIGNICLTPKEKCVIIQNTLGLRTNKFNDKKYLYHLLTYKNSEIKKLNRGMAQPSIRQDELLKLEVTIPNINEQHKISNFLSLLDKKIELQSKKIEGLKLFKKGLLKKNYYKIANNNLTELSCIANIYQPQTISQSELDNGKYYVFGANGIIGKYSKFNHKFMQVTISCRGENSGTINLTPDECWITGNSMVLNVDENKNVDKLYLKNILEAQNLKYLISGSGQPQIVRSSVLKHKIPYISIEQQKKFTIPFIKLDSKIKLEQNKLIKLQKLKKGLMQRMFV